MPTPLALQLQPASFRGVPFHVEGSGIDAGRRTQVHEYPQRDKPFVEDLGRASRAISVNAFVLGTDYIAQVNALIAAAETPGPGTLVHPWLGSLQVTLKEPAHVAFDQALGRAVVTLAFVEAGELAFPAFQTSTQSASQFAADDLASASGNSFASSFNTAAYPDYVATAASADFASALGFAATLGSSFKFASSWATGLVSQAKQVASYFANPQALAYAALGWFDLSPAVSALGQLVGLSSSFGGSASNTFFVPATNSTVTDPLTAIALGLVALGGNGGAGGALNAPVPTLGSTAARTQQVLNTAAITALTRRALLAQAVGISSVIDTRVQTDALTLRNALIAALDAESLLADDATYAALQTARRAVWADLTARASNGARLQSLPTTEVQPALVIAYDKYEDADRALEIVARNGLQHAGFVPVKTLQVLSV